MNSLTTKTSLFALIILFFLITPLSHARILDVPDDFETIQAGIDEAERGDTVLVQPGTYVENIDFDGKAITVGSLLLTTGDRAYIDSTIIDGNRAGSVARFVHNETRASVLRGMTLTNGFTEFQVEGAGIHIGVLNNGNFTGPTLSDLVISGNSTAFGGGGGGIYMAHGNPLITNCVIANNSAGMGGAINSAQASCPEMRYVEILNNTAAVSGGFYGDFGGELILDHVTICRNSSGHGRDALWFTCSTSLSAVMRNLTVTDNAGDRGPLLFVASGAQGDVEITMVNSILHGNIHLGNYPEIHVLSSDGQSRLSLAISYCDIKNGRNGAIAPNELGQVDFGEGIFDADPMFLDTLNNDYHLQFDSPCIDTGDPDGPVDEDGSRADIGAYGILYDVVVQGTIVSALSGVPIAGVTVLAFNEAGLELDVESDSVGFWRIAGDHYSFDEFNLNYTHPQYPDTTLQVLHVDEGDTLRVDIELLQPLPSFSRDRIDITLEPQGSEQTSIDLFNNGAGRLEWNATAVPEGIADAEPWCLRQVLNAGEQLDDDRIQGVVFVDEHFYISSFNDHNPQIGVFDREGNLVRVFPQFSNQSYGMRDLAYDGTSLWGAAGDSIYGFTTDGQLTASFSPVPNVASITCLAYDTERRVLWYSGTTTDIFAVTRQGEPRNNLQMSRNGLVLCGLAYRETDPDGFPLYLLNHASNPDRNMVHKMSLETGDTLLVKDLSGTVTGFPGGICFTDQYEVEQVPVLMIGSSDTQANGGDQIFVLQISPVPAWFQLEPQSGIVAAEATQEIDIAAEASHLAAGVYSLDLRFKFIAEELAANIPVIVTVEPNAVSSDNLHSPSFALESAFPNPFNSSTTIRFSTGLQAAPTRLSVYDLSGREVARLLDAHTLPPSHSHTLVWNVEGLPGGIYLIRLKSAGLTQTMKVIILK